MNLSSTSSATGVMKNKSHKNANNQGGPLSNVSKQYSTNDIWRIQSTNSEATGNSTHSLSKQNSHFSPIHKQPVPYQPQIQSTNLTSHVQGPISHQDEKTQQNHNPPLSSQFSPYRGSSNQVGEITSDLRLKQARSGNRRHNSFEVVDSRVQSNDHSAEEKLASRARQPTPTPQMISGAETGLSEAECDRDNGRVQRNRGGRNFSIAV